MRRITILVIMAVALAGCATRQESGALVGAVAGGILGNQIGKGTGRVLATAAGAVIGGIIGSEIGRSMDEADRRAAMEAEYYALEEEEIGSPRRWRNPRTGHHGEVVARREYTYNGMECREYTHTIYIDGEPDILRGKACKQPDGTWKAVG